MPPAPASAVLVPAAAAPDGAQGGGPGSAGPPAGRFVLSVACSPDGRWLAAGCMDGSVAVFDLPGGGRFAHWLRGHSMPVRSLAFTPDSAHVLTACDDG